MAFPDAFFRRGYSKIFFLPAVADTSAPTRAEITAGTDLSDAIQSVSGWSEQTTRISLPNLGSAKTFQLNGEITYPDSSLTLYDDKTTDAIRTTLAADTAGFIVLFPYGDVATERCEVWPVECDGPDDQFSIGNDAALVEYEFAVTSEPDRDAVVPAAA